MTDRGNLAILEVNPKDGATLSSSKLLSLKQE